MPAVASAGNATAVDHRQARGRVRVLACASSDPDARSATFLGRMRSVPGADRLMMRFTLLERFGDEKLSPVPFGGLRAWRTSKPGSATSATSRPSRASRAAATTASASTTAGSTRAGTCAQGAPHEPRRASQKGDLPNLLIGQPRAQAGPEGTAVYLVPVQNNGLAPASGVTVDLSVDGAATNVGQVDSIAPGETREVRFTGPVCKSRLRAVVDPVRHRQRERLESDNVTDRSAARRVTR